MIGELRASDVERVVAVLGLARLLQGDGTYLVSWDGDEPTGHVHVTDAEVPELQDLEVRPEFRGRGVATALLAAAESRCRARGATRVRVTVGIDNDVARGLYGALGYRDVGVPPRRVLGTVQIRSGPIEVDDTLLTWEKHLDEVAGDE